MDGIQTSLDFIGNGMEFPPKNNIPRLEAYRKHASHYDRSYALKRKLTVRTPEGDKTYKWQLISMNYFKLVTDKFLGLLLNEKPLVKVADKEHNKRLNDLIDNSDFWYKFQQVAMSFSQFGDGVFHVYRGKDGAEVGYVQPKLWYKIVDPEDINHVTCHLLVHPIHVPKRKGGELIYECKFIRFIAHYRGYYSEIVFTYSGSKLGKNVNYDFNGRKIPKEGVTFKTGLSDFAIQSVHNSKPLTQIYGKSEYDAIEDAVYEYEKRLTLNSAILDKHSEPTMVADEDLFVPDETTGSVTFKGIGGIVGIRKDGVKPEYVTWDGKTDASEEMMTRLENNIITLSEYGKTFLLGEYSGNASGEALKTAMKGALDKVSRQIDSLQYTVRKVLCLMMELEGIKLSVSDISILWQDGITESDKTVAETVKIRRESSTLSIKGALVQYYGLSEEQAEKMYQEILSEPRGGQVDGQV